MQHCVPESKNTSCVSTIMCSAKTLLNLSETFWFAQKAVLYPTSPLYDSERKELTSACVRALTRVFRICDTDNDGYLSDRELEAFQSRCFSVPLTSQSLQDVKMLVRQSCPGGMTVNGITQKGFLFLHQIFVQKGRHETTWTVLRQFGYDNQLRLSSDFLYPKFFVPSDCSTEISLLGSQFLSMLFTKYDLDRDGCLSPAELAELLATCPTDQLSKIFSLTDSVTTNSTGWITQQGFMAFWALMAYLEPTKVLEYFAHLGFTYFAAGSFWSAVGSRIPQHRPADSPSENSLSSDLTHSYKASTGPVDLDSLRSSPRSEPSHPAGHLSRNSRDALLRGLVITAEKRLDSIRRSTQRTVFYCRVYGARQVGKSCLLQGLLGRHLRGSGGMAIGGISGVPSSWSAACGIPVYGQPRTLLMHEIGSAAGEKMTAGEALSADVACLVYDVSNPDSFRYVADLFLNYYRGTRVPCLFVGAKSDQPHVVQNYQVDPGELTLKYNLSPPESFSSIHLEQQLIMCGSVPHRPTPVDSVNSYSDSPRNHARSNRRSGSAEPSYTTPGGYSRAAVSIPRDHRSPLPIGFGAVERDADPSGSDPLTPMRQRRHSRPDMIQRAPSSQRAEENKFAPVYITLCTLANYPHLRGLQLAPTDHAWKWTLAATILAGFGFVAFRIAKTHF
ncbi:unnamed protein product [Dicrocoelium dendriticum]|nr:unnamed protein product [Dicrocoelium dendriticum]